MPMIPMINPGDLTISGVGDIICSGDFYVNAVFEESSKECEALVSKLKKKLDIKIHTNKCNFYFVAEGEIFYFNFDGIFFYIHPFEIRNYPKDSNLNTILNNSQASTFEKSLYLKNMNMLYFNNGLAYFRFRSLLEFSF